MKKYIVRTKSNPDKNLKESLKGLGIDVVFEDGVLPDLLIIETTIAISELRTLPFFKEVNEERVGSVNI